ncbi:MAG: ORF6N domain-containing protein [Desulfovibrio sp.]|jgi:hypothetical protein|nr:ORF6N domain-containing protein [Desulfovibrio sp.]
MSDDITPFTMESVIQRICELRGQRVMLDSDLAVLYGVETGALVRAVKRNIERFPDDFMFQLTDQEWENLRCQFGISSLWGGRRSAPYAFTEHGTLMLSGVLKSPRATEINVLVVRAFVWLRQTVPAYQEIANKLAELEKTVSGHDSAISEIIQALQQLMMPPDKDKRRIGF